MPVKANPSHPSLFPNLPWQEMMNRLDQATQLLEAADQVIRRINSHRNPDTPPVTMADLVAVLETNLVISCLINQIEYMRDPEHYFEEEYHGE